MGENLSIAVGLNDSFGGHIGAGDTQRRSVSADSFRRLTALLKKPAASSAPSIPDLQFAPLFAPAPIAREQTETDDDQSQFNIHAELATELVSAPMIAESAAAVEIEVSIPVTAAQAPLVPEMFGVAPGPVAHDQAVEQPAEPKREAVIENATPEPIVETKPELAQLHAASHLSMPKRLLYSRKTQDDFNQLPDPGRFKRNTKAPAAPPAQTPEQEADKTELARSLLDMMAASAGGGQPQERALAADTLLRMLPQLSPKMRTTLAKRLAIMEAPPPFLVSRLIGESDLSIAGPLLEDCSHISDEDLFAVIEKADVAKCRLLARRRKISRPVAEALARSKDGSVLLTLARNQGAEIPQEGFAALAANVGDNPELLAPLCTRSDLPVHFAFELFWLAPAQLRRYLLSRFLTDSEMLTKILKITMGTEAESAEPTQILELSTIGHAMEQVMGNEREAGMRTLATAGKVNVATVERIFSDAQGEPLMALLKSIGVPRSEVEKALPLMAQGNAPVIDPQRSLDEVQAVFDQLSFNKARILLTYWDWASTHSGPYAPAH